MVIMVICSLCIWFTQPCDGGLVNLIPDDHSYVLHEDISRDISLGGENGFIHPMHTLSDMPLGDHNSSTPSAILQRASITEEQARQDEYLADFGLTRRQVLGDGNCLFRSVSVGLVGHEGLYQELRNMAVQHMRVNIDSFGIFFHPDHQTDNIDNHIVRELDYLARDGSYAGQESVVALTQVLGINILVTYGGLDRDHRVFTMEHFNQVGMMGSADSLSVHVVFSNVGGGHYDAVSDRSNVILENGYQNVHVPEVNIQSVPRSFNWKETPFSKDVSGKLNTNFNAFENKIPKSSTADKSSNDKGIYEITKGTTVCEICKKKVSCLSSLKRHYVRYHPEKKVIIKTRPQFNKCIVPSCTDKFRTIKQLLQHLEMDHKAAIKRCYLKFDNFEQFLSWKEKEEMEHNVFFSKTRKETKSKVKTCFQFICSRDGNKRVPKTSQRCSKKRRQCNIKGSCKTGNLCPARMYVAIESNCVNVEYIQTHTHSVSFDQSKYLPMPQSLREDIGKKLSLGIPVDTILDDIRSNVGNINSRDLEDVKFFHLVNRKNIMNMKKDLVDCKYQKHQDDATSTLLWVQYLQSDLKTNPVLLFKPQYKPDISTPLQTDDFMLVLMTNEQADMYKKFGGRILCLDSTHKTNMYDFKLVTLLVIDDYHRGYPVAFCISNREDTTALQIFLNSVKSKCPDTKINILLTDDDSAGINAARSVFGDSLQHHLCIWHVYQSWRRKLHSSVNDKDHKVEMFFFLHSLLNAASTIEYNQYLTRFTEKFSVTEPVFFQYFKDRYLSRQEKWALHMRQKDLQTEINTNMFLESFHNKLKTVYFQRKQNKRIDKLISVLLEMEKHYYLNRLRYTSYQKPTDFESSQCTDRHSSGLCIPDNFVHVVNENQVTVRSSDSDNIYYTINVLSNICHLESCFKKCHNIPCMNLCRHMYTCSCPDKHPLCKHIHKVHSMNSMHNTSKDSVSQFIHTSENISQKNNKEENLLKRYKKALKQLDDQVSNPEIRTLRLESIVTCLENLITTNKASTCISAQPMKPTFSVNSNQKLETQPKFKKTQKNRTKPKKSLKAPSNEDKMKLLLTENASPDNTVVNGPSVAPYPPLYLVPPSTTSTSQPQQTNTPTFSLVNSSGSISIPNNFLVPPSLHNQRLTIKLPDGREMKIIASNKLQQEDESEN